jgi:phosphoribosyl 1,2-cyclic phosphodiesterase
MPRPTRSGSWPRCARSSTDAVAIRFASLGSGSDGNALLVEARDGATSTRVLLDCGFSVREIEKRLARKGASASDLDAIFVTHEHGDHVAGALKLARRTGIPIYMSWGTALACGADEAGVDLRVVWGDEMVAVGDFEVLPYTVPHDAREPLQFVFSDGGDRLGVLTDAGAATPHMRTVLEGCAALILECNHDKAMLSGGRYPHSLKARIGGALGHLSNDTAASILGSLDSSRLAHIIAAHLSQENNTAALARAALAAALNTGHTEVIVATQADGFDWLQV